MSQKIKKIKKGQVLVDDENPFALLCEDKDGNPSSKLNREVTKKIEKVFRSNKVSMKNAFSQIIIAISKIDIQIHTIDKKYKRNTGIGDTATDELIAVYFNNFLEYELDLDKELVEYFGSEFYNLFH